MLEKIKKSIEFIKSKINFEPEVGIILGSGLGNLVNEIAIKEEIPYREIPNFPFSTVKGHKGSLIFGVLGGRNVIAMQGRFHYYEGYDMQEVTFPIRVMKQMGIKLLIVSNASGGMNPDFKIGDIMLITDHINLMPNPLVGKNEETFGDRFPDMSEAYDRNILNEARAIAKKLSIKLQEGVYAGVTGPTFETPAEYRYFRIIGADAVGMSTVPEVIVARHMKLPVFALSVITDLGIADQVVTISHQEVLEAAENAQPKMAAIIKQLLTKDIL